MPLLVQSFRTQCFNVVSPNSSGKDFGDHATRAQKNKNNSHFDAKCIKIHKFEALADRNPKAHSFIPVSITTTVYYSAHHKPA